MPGAPRSFLFLVVRPGAPGSVLDPSSDARSPYSSFFFLVVGQEPLVASLLLVPMPQAPTGFLFLVVRPGAPSSVLAPSSDARGP